MDKDYDVPWRMVANRAVAAHWRSVALQRFGHAIDVLALADKDCETLARAPTKFEWSTPRHRPE